MLSWNGGRLLIRINDGDKVPVQESVHCAEADIRKSKLNWDDVVSGEEILVDAGDHQISLEPVDWETQGALLTRWLESAEVSRWWGDPDGQVDQLRRIPEDSHAIIAAAAVPIGYIRWQVTDRGDLDAVGLTDVPTGSIDIDLFIGAPHLRGRGLATSVLRLLTDRLEATTDAPAVGLCTSVENHRAIKAFTKAGFSILTQYDDPTYGPCHVFLRTLSG